MLQDLAWYHICCMHEVSKHAVHSRHSEYQSPLSENYQLASCEFAGRQLDISQMCCAKPV